MNKEKRLKEQKRINGIIENFSNVVFKPEGLGALEFEREIYSEGFEVKNVKFRIERVALQVAERLEEVKAGSETSGQILKTFIAVPSEARSVDFFKMDYTAMREIIELISEFQVAPFLFTEGARKSEEVTTK